MLVSPTVATEPLTGERAFFDDYYANRAFHPHGERLRLERELRSLLRASGTRPIGRVLSVGCGDGEFELLLAPHAEHVTGVDLSPEAIRIAREAAARDRVRNVEFRCSTAAELDTRDRFDTIVCLAFLHHVPEAELRGFLDGMLARLIPGGLLYSQDPNVHGLLRKIGRAVMGRRYDTYHTADEREIDPGAHSALLHETGFVDVRIEPIDLTLIPAMFLLRNGPAWPLRACVWVDRLWCATPLGRWATGFAAAARRPL